MTQVSPVSEIQILSNIHYADRPDDSAPQSAAGICYYHALTSDPYGHNYNTSC